MTSVRRAATCVYETPKRPHRRDRARSTENEPSVTVPTVKEDPSGEYEEVFPDQPIKRRKPPHVSSNTSELRHSVTSPDVTCSLSYGLTQLENTNIQSRNAKTAPPTPEAEARGLPRNAESTSQLEMMSTVYRKSLSNSSYSTKSSDQQNGHSPPKDGSPYKLKKNRNEKFHKLFKCLAEDEVALKSYSCAYFGDILLQGYLYISRNWFCFYSKILGQEKRLTIPVSAVLNITREKTAIFIPNAIGILTSEDKYVFGSLLQRDNAHRLMASVWKQFKAMEACNKEDPDIDGGDVNPENGHQVVHDPNNADGESQADSSVSDSSVCFHCGMPKTDHDEQSCELNMDLPDTDRRDSQSGHSDESNEPNNNVKLKPTLPHKNYMPIHCFSLRNVFRTLSQGISNIQHMPRTSLFLGVCIILVLFLFASAVILFYKVLLLQAIIDSSGDWMDQGTYKLWQSHRLYSDMYYLSDQFHAATIQRFHSVLKANIQILTEIQHSLKSLQNSPILMEKSLNGSS